MAFNLNIFSAGGGGSSAGGGVTKYPTAAALPASPPASDGDVGITLDTNNLYSYDSGVGGWVVIGGPGIAISVADTNSNDLTLTLNVLTADLRIPPGITGVPAGFNGITLSVYAGASPGLAANIQGFPVFGSTSGAWSITGPTAAIMGGTLQLVIQDASASNPGLMTQFSQTIAGTKFFNDTIIGWSGIGLPQPGGPGTIYLNAPASVSPSYNFFLPGTQGLTFSFMMTDGLGGATWSQISPTFMSGITGPIIANGPGKAIGVMQAGGITLANLTGIDPNTFLGNPTGATAGVTTITLAVAKSLLGLTLNNSGDVTLGAFLYAGSSVGATISAAQVLSLTWGDTTNPGAMSSTHQVFAGDKRTTGNLGMDGFLKFFGSSILSIGSSAQVGYTIMLPTAQGSIGTVLLNYDGLGNLKFSLADPGRVVAFTGQTTLSLVDTYIEVTTGVTNQVITLAQALGNTGCVQEIMKVDSGLGTLSAQSPDLINGVTLFTWSSQWEVHKFKSNGVGWRVVT